MTSESPRTQRIPSIVRIILTQATKHRAHGLISSATFAAQIARVVREELEPRGFDLLIRELSTGQTRFLIKSAENGAVYDMIECESEPETSFEVRE
jgi:hypothetical protein